MKIGIDVQPLMGKKTGVGYYTTGILKAMAAIDRSNDYKLVLFKFFTRPFSPPIELNKPNFHYGIIGVLPGRVFSKLLKWNLLPPLDIFLGRRLYIFPNFVSWPLLFSPSAVVIYDLSYILHAKFSDEQNRRFLTKFVPRSLKRASLVITISENSKREIIDYYGIDPQKIVVAYPAIDPNFFQPAQPSAIETVRTKFNLPEKYLLYVGTLEPRKNIVGLLDSYTALPTSIKQHYPLVLAGGKGWKDGDIGARLAAALEAKEPIIQTGYFEEEDLPPLFSGAAAFVYPSHYEGFGMPPVEAMACGCPVITSDNSSLPEAVGNAAIMVKADDAPALTKAIQEVISKPKLAASLRQKGFKQAGKFRWEASARIILEAVQAVNEAG